MTTRGDIACPACRASGAAPIYRRNGVPVHSSILFDDPKSARAYRRGDIELAFCSSCGLIFNRLFDPAVMAYAPDFEESQHASSTFTTFARALAGEIARHCHLDTVSRVLEIGCGKGEFLAELCQMSGCTGIGIDPAFRPDRLSRDRPPGLSFIVDQFGPRYAHLAPDVVLCRHTLEHIGPVGDFIADIGRMVGPRTGVWTVFETPDVLRVLAEAAFWDIYYEHVSYFTVGSHARLFRRNDFTVTDIRLDYGGQYILQYATPAGGQTPNGGGLEDDLDRTAALAATFAERVDTAVAGWRTAISGAVAAGRQVVFWGGGSKAVAFLADMGPMAEAVSVVDKNSFKHGRYLAGSGHRVLAPAELVALPPDVVVAMNPIYREEIRRDLAAFGLAPEIVGLGS